jgi:hypothetical protein
MRSFFVYIARDGESTFQKRMLGTFVVYKLLYVLAVFPTLLNVEVVPSKCATTYGAIQAIGLQGTFLLLLAFLPLAEFPLIAIQFFESKVGLDQSIVLSI